MEETTALPIKHNKMEWIKGRSSNYYLDSVLGKYLGQVSHVDTRPDIYRSVIYRDLVEDDGWVFIGFWNDEEKAKQAVERYLRNNIL